MVDVISSSSENPIVLTIGNIPSQSHTLILIWLFSLLKQDEAKKETPPITAHFHQRYSLNNKWSNRSNGNSTGLPGGHSNNKGSTSHFSNKNLFDNQGKHNVQGNQGSLKSPQHHWHPNHEYGGDEDVMIGHGKGISITQGHPWLKAKIKGMSTSGQRLPHPPQPSH
ncbi:hypothetical protein AAG906_019123 [Vitis piasezkii]